MCARSYREPRDFEEPIEPVQPSWRNLGEWVRAWRRVIRDPDKTIPESGLGPEGDPIPENLDLLCPECGYNLSGLIEWRCPECGEEFNPRRLYTLRMLRQPEYFLRYRYNPEDIRRVFLSLVLLVVGLLLAGGGALISSGRAGDAGWVSIWFGIGILSAFSCLTMPVLLLLHFAADMPWSRVFFRFALPWFLLCTLLFVAFVF